MRTLIVAHGDPPSRNLIEKLARDSDVVIATDGAANGLIPAGIVPNLILGDFDSLDPALRAAHPELNFVSAESQEASDLDKAVAHALELGAVEIVIAGAGGGRLDHTLTNVSLLLKYHTGADIVLVDDRSLTRAVNGEATFEGRAGDTLSLIVFEPVRIGWTDGLRWPLRQEILLPGSRGISNLFTQPIARIKVESGTVIVCHLRNPDAADSNDELLGH